MRRHVRRRRRAYAGGAGLTAALLAGAGGGHVAGHHPGQAIVTPSPESTPVVSDTNIPGSGCDASFERFTYNPQRLVRILCERCKVERRLLAPDLAADPRYGLLGLREGEAIHEPCGYFSPIRPHRSHV